jgi:hypothetical protein
MTMEKTGDLSDKTPQKPCCGGGCHTDKEGQPLDKQAADQLQDSPVNRAVDAVAEQTEQNQPKG